MMSSAEAGTKTYVVEHLDQELGPWSVLEYAAIAQESHDARAKFCLSSVPQALRLPPELQDIKGLVVEYRSVEVVYGKQKNRVCLLDPAASKELSPGDGEAFDVFLFGGILGMPIIMRCPSTMSKTDLATEEKVMTLLEVSIASREGVEAVMMTKEYVRSNIRVAKYGLRRPATWTHTNDDRHGGACHQNCGTGERYLLVLQRRRSTYLLT